MSQPLQSIEYLHHRHIDKDKWDECVKNSPDGNIYSLSWYQDIVAPGWNGIVRTADGSSYDLVMIVPWFRKFAIPYVRMPYFANQLGIISCKPLSIEDLNQVLHLLKRQFHYILDYPMNVSNQPILASIIAGKSLDTSFSVTSHLSYEIDLNSSYDILYENFTPDRKKNVKKALGENISLNDNGDIEQLIKIHKRFTSPRIYGGVTEYQYSLLRRLFLEVRERKLGSLFDVRHQNQIIASCLFLSFKKHIIKFCNVSTSEGRRLNADSFMMHSLLEQWAGREKTIDFERASLPGINHYKKSFGAKEILYSSVNYNNLPKFIKTVKRLRSLLLDRKNKWFSALAL